MFWARDGSVWLLNRPSDSGEQYHEGRHALKRLQFHFAISRGAGCLTSRSLLVDVSP